MTYLNFLVLLSTVLMTVLTQRIQDGSVQEAPRPATRIDLVKSFDLPRSAPTARIIRLSEVLTRKHSRGRKNEDLLRDRAGSFDDFSAFNFKEDGSKEKSEESGSSEEKPMRREKARDRDTKDRRREKDEDDGIIGDFFKEEGRQ